MSSLRDDYLSIYRVLDSETRYIFHLWTIYNQLFDTKENVDVLNLAAGDVFACFQQVTNRDIVQFIYRTLDKQQTGGNKNLTLFSLLDKRFEPLFPLDELEKTLMDLKDSNDFKRAKDIRNKILAHSDISKLNQPDTKHTLPFQSIQYLIASIGNALNFTSYHVFNETTLYEQTITNLGSDGIALINRLKETNDHQRHHQRQTQ